MKKYGLDFLEVEDQRKCFAALYENQVRENHEQTTADFLSAVGMHADAFGAGRVPVFTYLGNDGWLVNLVYTEVGSDERRVVERCYVFSQPKYPEVAKRLEQLVRHAVIDVLSSVGEQREQHHRKLRHIASTVDPMLTTMFSYKTPFETQMQLLDRIEDRTNRASVDKTVAQHATLLYLTKLLHFIRERGTRLGKRKA